MLWSKLFLFFIDKVKYEISIKYEISVDYLAIIEQE